jgi:hypothetical protein
VDAEGEPCVTFIVAGAGDGRSLQFRRVPVDESGLETVRCEGGLLGGTPAIASVLLTPTQLVVTYQPHSPRELVIGHRASGAELKALRQGMRRVFRGTGLFVDDAATGLGLLKAILVGPPTPTSEMLVVPLYMTVVGVIAGVIVTALLNPWLIPVGVVAGAGLGCLVGFLKRGRFYGLHKYQ